MNNFDDIIVLSNKIEPIGYSQNIFVSDDKYVFVIFQSDISFSYDGINFFDVPENSAILYSPGSLLCYKTVTSKLLNSFMYVEIDPKMLESYSFPINTLIHAEKEIADEIVFEMDRLSYIVNTPYAENMKSKIPDYVARVFKLLDDASFDLKSKINTSSLKITFSNIRSLMYTKPTEFTVNKMANMVGFSETYFGIKYKEFFGITPSLDRKIRIVEIIKYYLEKTDYSLIQLCDIFEIKSVAHLINTFKSITKTTPNKYRMKLRKTK